MRFGVDSQRRIDTNLKFHSLRLKPFQHVIIHAQGDRFSSPACAIVHAQNTDRPTVEYLNDFLCVMRGDIKHRLSRHDNRARQNVTYPLFLC